MQFLNAELNGPHPLLKAQGIYAVYAKSSKLPYVEQDPSSAKVATYLFTDQMIAQAMAQGLSAHYNVEVRVCRAEKIPGFMKSLRLQGIEVVFWGKPGVSASGGRNIERVPITELDKTPAPNAALSAAICFYVQALDALFKLQDDPNSNPADIETAKAARASFRAHLLSCFRPDTKLDLIVQRDASGQLSYRNTTVEIPGKTERAICVYTNEIEADKALKTGESKMTVTAAELPTLVGMGPINLDSESSAFVMPSAQIAERLK